MSPVLHTARLVLRPLRYEDAAPWAALMADPGVHRNVGSFPDFFTPLHAESRIMVARACHAQGRFTNFALEQEGVFVGTIGIGHAGPVGDLGYALGRAAWGQGLATEAGTAVLAWADAALNLRAIRASHYTDNPASGRVLEKLGFVADGGTEWHFCMGRMAKAEARTLVRATPGAAACAPAETQEPAAA